MKAVIMAGGEGTRLRPLTCDTPKPMVPVVNRPMMEHILNLLKKHDIKEIANTLWYLPEDIQDYFGDGSSFGVHMEYFIEHQPLGTAGSVKNAQAFLDETFIVVSGDCLTDINLTEAVAYHKGRGALATIVLTSVPNPLSYGVVIVDDEGRINQFLEKPSWSEVFSDTVNTGIYILEPEVLAEFAANQKFDFSKDLFPKLLQARAPLFGYVATGYWSDVGNLDVYRQAQKDCLDGAVRVDLPPQRSSGVWVEPDVELAADVDIRGPVYIGKKSRVGPGASLGPYTVLGANTQIGSGTSLKRTTLWSGVCLGDYCEVRGAVLADQSSVGDGVRTYEGVVVGVKSRIGAHSTLSPNVKVWPGKQIVSGSRLVDSVVWGHQEDASLFTAQGIQGDIRGSLSPEMILRMGLAIGDFTGNGQTVLVTADSSKVGRVAKRALTAGLLAAGVDVLDGGTVAANMTRFGTQFLGVNGAIHCLAVPDRDNIVTMQVWDSEGKWLSKSDERKIENILLREDFPRQTGHHIGELSFVPDLSEQYTQCLAKLYQRHVEGLAVGFHVRDDAQPHWADLVRGFLTKVGCHIQEKPSGPSGITITISNTGWHIADESGETMDEDQWWQLFIQALKGRHQHQAAIPIDASRVVADVAKNNGMSVQWTKTDLRNWMEIASELGNTHCNPQDNVEFYPHVEPLVTIAEILRLLRTTSQPLSSLKRAIPTTRHGERVFCPWKDKGRVMRHLIGMEQGPHSQFLGGIKSFREHGWALVIPDGDEPVFQIYSEADTQEEADALIGHYKEAIGSILSREGVH